MTVPFSMHPTASELSQRATEIALIVSALKEQLTALVKDDAYRCNKLDGDEMARDIKNHLMDLVDELCAPYQRTAEDMIEGLYAGAPRGPFYRARP